MKPLRLLLVTLLIPGLPLGAVELSNSNWLADLNAQLPLMGHRNWIAIVDSAYPLQNASGIVTINTDADHIEVVQSVLTALKTSRHVQGTIYLDAELPFVPESSAHGIEAFRAQLTEALRGKTPTSLPHEQIINQLSDAGKTFRVLILKSRLTLPYTSVFIRLDCGYWNADAEKHLRDAILKSTEAK